MNYFFVNEVQKMKPKIKCSYAKAQLNIAKGTCTVYHNIVLVLC